MPKHSLKQLEDMCRDWGLYKWLHADNPDKEPVRARKNTKPKTSFKKGQKNNNYNKRK